MKTLNLILTFCILNFFSFSQEYKVNEYYKSDSTGVINGSYVMKCNDNILVQGYFQKGEAAGRWTFFNISGQKIIDGFYLNGLMNGKWTHYKDNKVITEIGYKQGVFHGVVKSNYLNGNPRIVFNYNNGTLDGEVKFFYENGNLKEERYYSSGLLDSLFIVYDKNQNEKIKILYKQNIPISIIEAKESNDFVLKFKGNLTNGTGGFKSFLLKSGYEIPLELRNYTNGKLNGEYVSYNNGIKAISGNFESGLMVGKWKYYNQSGQVIDKKEFTYADSMDFSKIQNYQHNITEFDFTNGFYFVVDNMPLFLGQEITKKINSGIIKISSDDLKNEATNFDTYLNSEIGKLNINSKGNVFVEFTVGLLGEVKDVKMVRGFSENENEQIFNIFKSLPAFEPGYLDGFPVNVKYTKPINFK